MNSRYNDTRVWVPLRLWLIVAVAATILGLFQEADTAAAEPPPVPRIHAPYFPGTDAILTGQAALIWFGEVTTTSNAAIARIGYNDDRLSVFVHIFDRHLVYDTSANANDLTQWDAVTLYLNTSGNKGTTPTADAYQLIGQLNHHQDRKSYQRALQGNGSDWTESSFPFTTKTGWRGDKLNGDQANTNDRGWTATFSVRFADLGLSAPPASGTNWGIALAVHDRDNIGGAPLSDQLWPNGVNTQVPATWGELIFGRPSPYLSPPVEPQGEVTIRNKLNGAVVKDGSVGGYTICGEDFGPDFFAGWGHANYGGYGKINIQNQWDVADWPCFSRYYVTFPLNTIPAGKTIISATLTLHHFGNAYPAKAPNSLIQVYTVAEDWEESTLTWNNSPQAQAYVDSTWVTPIFGNVPWPGVPIRWDVSRAVSEMYTNTNQGPLRLVLFSADEGYHSGKYFSSSHTGDWNANARPTLHVIWGEVNSETPPLQKLFVPLIQR